jgi:trehalose/maltose hydrolase-like predicted phosphorylase
MALNYITHVFWDELSVFPVLNLRLPELSRSLLAYPYHRLPAARRLALRSSDYRHGEGSPGRRWRKSRSV